jgi:HK97 family phage major capsid protein
MFPDIIRNQIAVLDAERDALKAESDTLASTITTEARSTTEAEDTRLDEILARNAEIKAEREAKLARLAELEDLQAERTAVPKAPNFIPNREAPTPTEVRNLSRSEARDAAMRILEDRAAMAHLPDAANVAAHLERQLVTLRSYGAHGRFDGNDIARRLLVTETDAYRSAFTEYLRYGGAAAFTPEQVRAVQEFRAMSIGTDTAGGFGIPVLIDPSIILTSQGSFNPMRKIGRVIQITNDEWKGVSSAGVTWSIDAEAAAVSDDTPTLAQPTVTTSMARGYIPYSIEAGMDYPGFASEMGMLLSEGYDDIQASHMATGNVSSTNRGIITALDANTNVEVIPTTDGAFGAVDISKVWGALPDRFKANATWVMNHDVGNEVSSFSTSGQGSFFTVTLAEGNAPQLKGRPVEFATYFSDFTGTTGPSNLLVVGDFRNFVIVDRAGMNVEVLPLVVDVTNNRPTGQRGLFAWARFGSNSVNDLGFRLLQNQ